jgi:hypothetical protein
VALGRDGRLIFATRAVRMFGYGLVSVVLVLYLAALGLSGALIGVLLTLTLLGDAAISLWLTTHADSVGRRRVLVVGALLMCLAGLGFAATAWLPVLVLAATVGVISPSGNEVGPFLAVESAALSQTVSDHVRTRVFGWFNLTGSFATALGALTGGGLAAGLIAAGLGHVGAYRLVIVGYALLGLALAGLFLFVRPDVDCRPVAEVPGGHRVAGGRHVPHAALGERHGRGLRIEGAQEYAHIARVKHGAQLSKLFRLTGEQHVVPLGIDGVGPQGSAAEQPDRRRGEDGSIAPDESGGLLQPVKHVRRAPDHDGVVGTHVLYRAHRPGLGLEAVGAQPVRDVLGDAPGRPGAPVAAALRAASWRVRSTEIPARQGTKVRVATVPSGASGGAVPRYSRT